MFQYPHPPRKLPINLFLRLELPRSMSPPSELFTSMSFHSCPFPVPGTLWKDWKTEGGIGGNNHMSGDPGLGPRHVRQHRPLLQIWQIDQDYHWPGLTRVIRGEIKTHTTPTFLGQKHLVSLFYINMSKVRLVVANGWFSLWRFNQSKAQTTHNQETNKLLETIENPETANPAEQLTRQDKNMIKYINTWHVNTLCYISFQDWYTTPWKLVVIVNVL